MRESLTCCTKQIAGLVNDTMFKVGYGQVGWSPLFRIGAICADAPVLVVCKVRVVVRTIGFAENFANFAGVLC